MIIREYTLKIALIMSSLKPSARWPLYLFRRPRRPSFLSSSSSSFSNVSVRRAGTTPNKSTMCACPKRLRSFSNCDMKGEERNGNEKRKNKDMKKLETRTRCRNKIEKQEMEMK